MTDTTVQRRFVTYHNDGRIEVITMPDGLPRSTCIIPAPMRSETEIQAAVDAALDAAALDGLHVEHIRRVRNPVFDRKGQKTSTEIVVRPCRNADEAAAVAEKVGRILGAAVCG